MWVVNIFKIGIVYAFASVLVFILFKIDDVHACSMKPASKSAELLKGVIGEVSRDDDLKLFSISEIKFNKIKNVDVILKSDKKCLFIEYSVGHMPNCKVKVELKQKRTC